MPIIAIVLVATVAVVVVRSNTPVELGPAQGGDLRGVLLYTAREGEAWRLYRWDLSTWTLTRGPLVEERPSELVHAFDVGEGVVGLIQPSSTGQTARILRHLDERDRAATVLRGDLVTWTPGGASAVAGVTEPAGGRCPDLVIRTYAVDRAEEDELLRQQHCGSLAALGRSFSTTFITVVSDRSYATMSVGSDGFSSFLGDWGLVGVSRNGTQLLVPTGTLPIESPQPLSRDSGTRSESSKPAPYGVGSSRLSFELLLGWAPRALGAYVLGTYDGQRGVYLASVDVGGGRWAPALVTPLAEGTPTLTETQDGVPLLAIDGRFYRARSGSLLGLEPPPGAPAPDGPILWLPSVPDSS